MQVTPGAIVLSTIRTSGIRGVKSGNRLLRATPASGDVEHIHQAEFAYAVSISFANSRAAIACFKEFMSSALQNIYRWANKRCSREDNLQNGDRTGLFFATVYKWSITLIH